MIGQAENQTPRLAAERLRVHMFSSLGTAEFPISTPADLHS
jgi:hypothetical protein